jgi:hypothetical protein
VRMAAVIFHQNRTGVRESHLASRKKLFEPSGGNPGKGTLHMVTSGTSFLGSPGWALGEATGPTIIEQGFLMRLTAKGLWQKRRLAMSEHAIYVYADKPPMTRKGLVSLVSDDGEGSVERWLVLEDGKIAIFASQQEHDAMGEPEATIGTSQCLMRLTKVTTSDRNANVL